ncbi:MAG: hypothetical protein HWN65_08370 [Candidatus Helarchaeota archaeon]|nr:hypothetical protein [Candidatus Helarchaeota archaeon]
MVKYDKNLDRNNKIHLPKPVRKSFGYSKKIVIQPNELTALIYPANTNPEDILNSLNVLKQEIENEIKRKNNKNDNKIND